MRSQTRIGAPVYFRPMTGFDMPAVLNIERKLGPGGWTEADFRRHPAMVAELGDAVVGYFAYRMRQRSVEVLRLAVHPAYRREGVGSALVAKLCGRLSHHRRPRLEVLCRETDAGTIAFLKDRGFQATGVDRGAFGEDDGYRFVLSLCIAQGIGAA
jgi:ribosomal-protein-alanine N-acetyltransferase